MGITLAIWKYLSNQDMIYHSRWIRKKIFHLFSNSIDSKSLCKVEWDLKRVSNLTQRINNYGLKNKYDLT